MRKIREQAEEMAEEGGELNLIPYLDIVTNVIMFMLATTTFAAALGDINVSSPTTASTAQLQNQPPPEPKNELNLTVSVSDKGFTIAASGAVLYQGFRPSTPPATSPAAGRRDAADDSEEGQRVRLRRPRARDGADQERHRRRRTRPR